jgi:hypothetical protein
MMGGGIPTHPIASLSKNISYKVISMLAMGSFGSTHSKTIGTILFQSLAFDTLHSTDCEPDTEWRKIKMLDVILDPQEFDDSKLTLFTEGTPVTTKILAAISENTTALQAMSKELAEAMVLNPKWVGAQNRTSVNFTAAFASGLGVTIQNDHGGDVWVSLLKRDEFRWGPGAVSLPGCSSIIVCAPGTACLYVHCLPVCSIISLGITLKDVKSFLNTPSGQQFTQNESKIIKVAESSVLFVPFGWCVSPLFMVPSADTKTKVKSASVPPHGFFIQQPLLSVPGTKALSAEVWNAVMSFNKNHHTKKGTERVWAMRGTSFTKFCDAVEAS